MLLGGLAIAQGLLPTQALAQTLEGEPPSLFAPISLVQEPLETLTQPENSLVAQNYAYTVPFANSAYHFLAIAGNVGLSDTTANISDDAIGVNGKLNLMDNISIRPSAFFGSDAVFYIPITYDFNIDSKNIYEASRVVPYLGGGVMIDTGGNESVEMMATAGLDYRITDRIVTTLGLNVGVTGANNPNEVGIMLGLGYLFPRGNNQ